MVGSASQAQIASVAQSTSQEFEVATIKPVDPKANHFVSVKVYPGGRVVINALSLKELICVAYQVSFWQISGGADWTGKELFDVEAIPPDNVRPVNEHYGLFNIESQQLRLMLQTLLTTRFHLQLRHESEVGQIYLLEASNKKLRLQEVQPSANAKQHAMERGESIGFSDRWVIYNTTMPQLAKFISDFVLHRPVLDRTGLNGLYKYKSAPSTWDTYASDPTGSFLDLLSQVGLKLKTAKGEVTTIIIEHADIPSPN